MKEVLGDFPAQVGVLPVILSTPGVGLLWLGGCKAWLDLRAQITGHRRVKEMEAWGWESFPARCRGPALSQVWPWQVIALLLKGHGLECT